MGGARGAGARRHGRGALLAGGVPAATEVLERAVALGEAHEDPFTLALALRFLGDIAINVDADLEKAERSCSTARSSRGRARSATRGRSRAPCCSPAGCRGRATLRRRRGDLAAGARGREDPDDRWARVRALGALDQLRQHGTTSTRHCELIERRGAARRRRRAISSASRSPTVQDGPRARGPAGGWRRRSPASTAAITIFDELGARWELADALAERGILKRELGRLDEAEDDLRLAIRDLRGAGRTPARRVDLAALAHVAERRGDEAEAKERFRSAEEAEARRPR